MHHWTGHNIRVHVFTRRPSSRPAQSASASSSADGDLLIAPTIAAGLLGGYGTGVRLPVFASLTGSWADLIPRRRNRIAIG